jgi:hypothetical protein
MRALPNRPTTPNIAKVLTRERGSTPVLLPNATAKTLFKFLFSSVFEVVDTAGFVVGKI